MASSNKKQVRISFPTQDAGMTQAKPPTEPALLQLTQNPLSAPSFPRLLLMFRLLSVHHVTILPVRTAQNCNL